MSEELRVVAATVIRVAPEGFQAPYVLAAVRSEAGGLSLGRVETPDAAAPAVGTRLHRLAEDRGTVLYGIAED